MSDVEGDEPMAAAAGKILDYFWRDRNFVKFQQKFIRKLSILKIQKLFPFESIELSKLWWKMDICNNAGGFCQIYNLRFFFI